MSRKIIVRVDGNPQIGIGHITRCLYFFDNIKENFKAIFYITENPQIKEYIKSRDYLVYELKKNISLKEEMKKLADISTQLLILDLRNKPESYFKQSSENFEKILRFDDLNMPINIYSNFYLNYNLYSEKINFNLKNKDTELFLGPKYYILNPIFKKFKNYTRTFNSKAKNILITMGGGDPNKSTIKVTNSIININDIHLNIILGKLFQNFNEINLLKTSFPSKITIYHDIKNMEEMMINNDIIISSGGNTSFEAAYMGIPGIHINQNKLQSQNSVIYNQIGAFMDLGIGEQLIKEEIRDGVKKLISSNDLRKKMYYHCKELEISKKIATVIQKFIS